ncbi:uncharacterized protein [Drosophila kikkawai]|uniref:Uncharacterized protein n=1 Tax=Drosophila kikkawai TaxID=30033 RepID=A0A6P4IXR7_DROKI|nr:ATP-dependent RNA helicase dbp2-like [Drosophila kikkawai]
MRLILLSVVVLLGLACTFALENNGANLRDLLGVTDQGDAHAEAEVREARGYRHGGRHGRGGGRRGGRYGGHHRGDRYRG